MGNLVANVQERIKTSSNAMSLLVFKALSGLVLGTTLALIGEEIVKYGVLSFVLVVVVATACLLRISKSWSWTHTGIFNLVCLLIGMLLHMYILIAPG